MTWQPWAFAVGAVLAVAIGAILSGIEIGLYTINRVRLSVRAGHGDRKAIRIQEVLKKPVRMFSTLMVATNIANYLSSYCTAGVIDHFGFTPGQSVLINALLLVPILFIFGETLPKDLFRTHTDRWSYAWSGFFEAVSKVLTWIGLVPLVELAGNAAAKVLGSDSTEAITARQRMSQLIKEGMGTGVLTEAQTTLADRALSLRDRSVQSVMVPWKKMLCIAPDADQKARELHMRYRSHTRLPVMDREGRVIGILSLLDALLEPGKTTRELMQPPLEFGPSVSVREALRRMREARQTMAIIVQGGKSTPVGMVTIKDLIEPLIGELAVW
jgi:CBS domain containing-hemolysin-like protein